MCKYSSVQEGDCDSRRGAQKLDVDITAGDGGVDAEGLFGVILELEIL